MGVPVLRFLYVLISGLVLTGMGKTQVAVSIIKRLEYDLKPWKEGGKRTVFVVPSVPLVEQQVNYIRRWTSFPVEGYHGNYPGLSWTKEFWDQQLEDNCILVLIHDILLKLLLHSLLGKLLPVVPYISVRL